MGVVANKRAVSSSISRAMIATLFASVLIMFHNHKTLLVSLEPCALTSELTLRVVVGGQCHSLGPSSSSRGE